MKAKRIARVPVITHAAVLRALTAAQRSIEYNGAFATQRALDTVLAQISAWRDELIGHTDILMNMRQETEKLSDRISEANERLRVIESDIEKIQKYTGALTRMGAETIERISMQPPGSYFGRPFVMPKRQAE